MNLSATAFITPMLRKSVFGLGWWTPAVEVALCDHATITSTAVLAASPRYASPIGYCFKTLSADPMSKSVVNEEKGEGFEPNCPQDVNGALASDDCIKPLEKALRKHFGTITKILPNKFE
jgi:predicted PhzF superfamily epimerase YddE/YHI9